MKRIFALCLMLGAPAASAQTVYKCLATNGHLTLSSEPCPSGQKETGAVDAPPERMTPQRRAELERRRRQDEANSAYLNRLAGYGSSTPSHARRSATRSESKHARCEAAKARRDAARRRMGMNVSYEATRRLDEMVYDACM